MQCRPHKLRNRAFPLGLFPEVQFYCRVTQCFDVIEVVKTRHMHIVTIADFPKDHYLSLACWLRTCQWYPTTTLSACDLWKMNLLYSMNIFPLVYESSFQSVLSHIEDSGSSCLRPRQPTLTSLKIRGHVIVPKITRTNYRDKAVTGICKIGVSRLHPPKATADGDNHPRRKGYHWTTRTVKMNT